MEVKPTGLPQYLNFIAQLGKILLSSQKEHLVINISSILKPV